MTTNSLRLMAVGIALLFAVLTGLFTGMVGGGQVCTGTSDSPSTQGPGQEMQEEDGAGTGKKPADEESTPEQGEPGQGQQPGQGEDAGEPTQPGPGGGLPGGTDPAGAITLPLGQPWAAPAQERCSDAGFSLPAAAVGFLGALLAGGAAVVLLSIGRRPQPAAVDADPNAGGVTREQLEQERSTLVQACIYVRDRATSKALADRLGWALQEVGVTTVVPTGARFDPAHHEAGGSAVTNDPAKVGTIAAVEVAGYVDRGRVLRAPVVTVYRQDGQ